MDNTKMISGTKRFVVAFILIAPFIATIYGIYAMWNEGVDMISLALLAGFWLFSGFGITVGYHRCFTHRGFEIHNETLKRLLAIGGSMAFEGPLIAWVSWHWQHHKHTDEEGDPHSPHLSGKGFWNSVKGFIHAHSGWFFNPPVVVDAHVRNLCKDKVLIEVSRQFKFWSLFGLILPAIIGVVVRGSLDHLLSDFLWGGPIRVFFVHHFTWSVNSICHIWGKREFATEDRSTNFGFLALFTLGESWHNNHHADMRSARHGFKWWQIDPSWYLILLLHRLGFISTPHVPSQPHSS